MTSRTVSRISRQQVWKSGSSAGASTSCSTVIATGT
jgi:hypothetical protein